MSKIIVDEIESSGSTITVPTGTAFRATDGLNSSDLPTVPVSKGGTGLTSLGSANQQLKVNSSGNALEFATASAGAVGNVQQVNYTASTSFTGSGRSNSDVVSGLNMTFSRDSQTSKTLLNYNITIGTAIDSWVSMKIQYSTDGSNFTDVPGITDELGSNTSLPRGHIGLSARGGGSSGVSEYSSFSHPVQILHDTSSISSSTIYYRIILFKGHTSNSKSIYINRAENMAQTGDGNRNCGTSQLTVMEIL